MSSRSDPPLHGSETAGRFSPVSPHSLPGGCPQPPPRHAPHLKKWPLAGSPGLLRSPHRESRLVNGFQICWRTSWCFVGVRCIVFVVHVVGGAVVLASTAFSVQPVSFFVRRSCKKRAHQCHGRPVGIRVCTPDRRQPSVGPVTCIPNHIEACSARTLVGTANAAH